MAYLELPRSLRRGTGTGLALKTGGVYLSSVLESDESADDSDVCVVLRH